MLVQILEYIFPCCFIFFVVY